MTKELELLEKARAAMLQVVNALNSPQRMAAIQHCDAAIDAIDANAKSMQPTVANKRYGCWNREEYSDIVKCQSPGQPVVEVPFAMSKTCQYTLTNLGLNDKFCEGCKHKKGVQSDKPT